MKKPLSAVCTLVILFLLFSAISGPPALSAGRTALVIGNGDYATAPLNNPVNDASDVAVLLRELGFEVLLYKNADKQKMISALRRFGKKLGSTEIGLFYFAGHGMQINGVNYLIPVGTSISEKSEVEFEALDAGRILAKMEQAGNPMNIVILDACRDNPFKRSFRSSAQGLAKMDAPPGTIIAYATSPGSLAADGSGRNGTYTAALLKYMAVKGLDVQKMFNRAGLDVMNQTSGLQVPWVSNTPFPDYFLAGHTPGALAAVPASYGDHAFKNGPGNNQALRSRLKTYMMASPVDFSFISFDSTAFELTHSKGRNIRARYIDFNRFDIQEKTVRKKDGSSKTFFILKGYAANGDYIYGFVLDSKKKVENVRDMLKHLAGRTMGQTRMEEILEHPPLAFTSRQKALATLKQLVNLEINKEEIIVTQDLIAYKSRSDGKTYFGKLYFKSLQDVESMEAILNKGKDGERHINLCLVRGAKGDKGRPGFMFDTKVSASMFQSALEYLRDY